jgi:hypothetical protein
MPLPRQGGRPDQLVATLREVCGRAFGPLALPPPGGLGGLAGEELERVWSILAAAPVATAVVGPDDRVLKVNPALCALVGHPETALLAAGYQLQQRCRRVDGEAIWCSATPGWSPTRAASPSTSTATGGPATSSASSSTCARAATPRTSWSGGPPTTPSPGCPTAACSWTAWSRPWPAWAASRPWPPAASAWRSPSRLCPPTGPRPPPPSSGCPPLASASRSTTSAPATPPCPPVPAAVVAQDRPLVRGPPRPRPLRRRHGGGRHRPRRHPRPRPPLAVGFQRNPSGGRGV